jgi:uncharacterized protein (DUF1501 family)
MSTRREFLLTAGAAGSALAGLTACGSSAPGQAPPPPTPPTPVPASPILVVINIDGGYDWLNVLPPTTGNNATAYQTLRPTLKVDLGAVFDLGSGVALNNDLTGLGELSQQGRVAWIPGIGMNNFSLSHFTAGDLWSQGANVPAGTGWLGRFADTAFSASGDVLRGITVTSDMPIMLKGGTRSFVSIPNSSGYVFPAKLTGNAVGAPYDTTRLENGLYAAVNTTSPDPGYLLAAVPTKLFLDAQNGFGTNGQLPARTPSVLYPGDSGYPVQRLDGGNLSSGFSNQLKLIAQMVASGLPGQVYFARLGGWDTHSNQAADHPNLQRVLGGALRAFYDDLKSISTTQGNAQDRVMILGYSEFGRRVKENNGGTDHGTAGLAFCLGNAVKGGMYGSYPDLNDLDANGNMRYSASADFRGLYATVLDRWLGQASTTTNTLLGSNYPRFGFL